MLDFPTRAALLASPMNADYHCQYEQTRVKISESICPILFARICRENVANQDVAFTNESSPLTSSIIIRGTFGISVKMEKHESAEYIIVARGSELHFYQNRPKRANPG